MQGWIKGLHVDVRHCGRPTWT